MTRIRHAGLCVGATALALLVTGSGGLAAEVLAAGQLLVLLAAALAGSLPARPGARGAAALGLCLVAAMGVSAARAPYVFASVDRWATWSSVLLLAWAFSRLERSAPSAERGRRELGLVVVLSGSLALVLQALAELGLPLRGAVALVEGSRRTGSFSSPNHLAEWLVLLAVAALPWAGRKGRLERAATLTCVVAAALAAATGSRIAPVAVLAGLLAFGLGRGGLDATLRRRVVLGLAIAGAIVAALAVHSVARRYHEPDAWARPHIWAAVAPAALERPLLGLGPGSFRHAHGRYGFPVEERVARHAKQPSNPHGEWLRLPIELGAVGTLLLLLLALARVRAAGAERPWASVAPWAAALAPMVAVHDVFHAPGVAAWAALGFVVSTPPSAADRPARQAPWGAAAIGRSLVLALLGLSALVGLVLRPTLAERAARRGDMPAALRWNPRQASFWLRIAPTLGAREAAEPERVAAAALAQEQATWLSAGSPEGPHALARTLAFAAQRLIPEAPSREAAARAWEEASERSPFDAFLLVERAVFLLGTGAPERAERLSEQALELEPRFVDAALVSLLAAVRSGAAPSALEDRRRRAERLLAASPELVQRAESDYGRRLVRPDPTLLEAAGLRDTTGR